jgi:hypothetical protein
MIIRICFSIIYWLYNAEIEDFFLFYASTKLINNFQKNRGLAEFTMLEIVVLFLLGTEAS